MWRTGVVCDEIGLEAAALHLLEQAERALPLAAAPARGDGRVEGVLVGLYCAGQMDMDMDMGVCGAGMGEVTRSCLTARGDTGPHTQGGPGRSGGRAGGWAKGG